MSAIDFQNGFVCGMATKGLTRSGEYYKPIIWNDEGIYTHFYIDFKREVQMFSTGMWNESVVVHDSVQIKATDVIDQTGGIYKIVCDISDRPHGITVMNKKTSRLRFASGEAIPVFSVHMFIAGIEPYLDAAYAYDKQTIYATFDNTVESAPVFDLSPNDEWGSIAENETMYANFTSAETFNLALT